MPASGIQAERQEKEAGSAGVPPIEAAGLRSNTGLLVAHIQSSVVAFPRKGVGSVKFC